MQVGVGGCYLAGCYGSFSKIFGSGAMNVLEARVVLANGSLVVANQCKNTDLFWSLRGGGAGVAGVVTEWTARVSAHTPR
jgi:FAD/FMN-containing dehydrogenase